MVRLHFQMHSCRRSSHEERGLKFYESVIDPDLLSRSSHEERGLKYFLSRDCPVLNNRRSSHEERGLKCLPCRSGKAWRGRRSSHEERGLKYVSMLESSEELLVAPRMRSVD